MNQSNGEHEERYQEHFWELYPIFEKHFPRGDGRRIASMVHSFIAAKEAALCENWNYKQQQDYLTGLRSQLRQAVEILSKIHPEILSEVSGNLTLPLVVLNGTFDRKTCAKEVFDLAPSSADIKAANHVLKGLTSFSENIDKAIKYTQDELPVGIPVGNRNIDAWRVVEAAVEMCRHYPAEMTIPKKMNGYGPLRRLLQDLLDYYNLSANVDAAFNGWLKNIDRKRETLELLPIY